MDFDFNDDQEMLRGATRSFLDKRSSIERRRSLIEAPEVFERDVWRDGAELGWTAMFIPEEHGGGSVSSQPLVDLVVLAEEFGRTLQPGPLVSTNIVADCLVRSAAAALAAAHLPAIAAGTSVAALCLGADTTPDPRAVSVRAEQRADGWTLHGTASVVHGASTADVVLIAARDGEELLLALVPAGAPGLSVRACTGLDLTRRFGDVVLDGVAVAPDAIVANGAPATAAFERAGALATVLQAAECVGAAQQLFATTLQYSKDRVQFGRAIGSFQAIKHRMADLSIAVETMRAITHDAALSLADGTADAAEAVAAAGSYVAPTHAWLCGECLQLTGGIGFTWEHDLHLFLRRARTDEVLFGDPSWHRERLCSLVEARTASFRSANASTRGSH